VSEPYADSPMGLAEHHRLMYARFSQARKDPAIAALREGLPEPTKIQIREAVKDDPWDWFLPYHFHWGMDVRNLLRQKGFGEDYWPVASLDNIYVLLVEEAVRE
jgi:hypothetical protein